MTDLADYNLGIVIASGSVSITGSVTVVISGTPTVSVSSGTISIGNVPTVKVASGAVNVGTVTSITNVVTITGNAKVQNVAGTILQTGDALTLLGHFTITAALSVGTTFSSITRTFGALLVVFTKTSGGTPIYAVAQPIVTGNAIPSFGAAFGLSSGRTAQWTAVVPMANLPTGTLTVTVYLSGTTKGKATVYGLTTNPGVEIRSDGRAYPLGVFAATVAAGTAATHTLLAAPGTPRRVMIKTLSLQAGGTTSGLSLASIKANIAGTVTPIIGGAGSTTAGVVAEFNTPQGLLTQKASGILLSIGTASGQGFVASVTYDLVV